MLTGGPHFRIYPCEDLEEIFPVPDHVLCDNE